MRRCNPRRPKTYSRLPESATALGGTSVFGNRVLGEASANRETGRRRPVRLLVNGLHSRSGGGATYLRNMLPHFAADPDIDLHLCIQDDQRHLLPADTSRITLHVPPEDYRFWRIQIWEQTALPGLARRIGADLTFSTSNYGPLAIGKSAVLIGNALAVFGIDRRLSKRLYWTAVTLGTALSLIRARRVLAVSAYAADAVMGMLPKGLRKPVAAIHHGVGPAFSPPPPETGREEFLLAVCDVYVQKNLENLVLAVARLRDRHPEISLKIAGALIDPGYLETLKGTIAANGLTDRVEFLGLVELEDLAGLYRRCRLFVFPSLLETFGIPLIEAMASGAPIASSDAAAMPEVVGDAGLYFDPTDVGNVAEVIGRLLDDAGLREDMSRKALARAAGFTWEKAAAETLAVLKDATKG